ncbi:uncharacterized protein FFB20_15897 [Fusarium fujikuroi]|nr:uncharacterized protein FFB20_15897 [Fusarium fujikuroi]
MVDGLGE